MGEGSENLRVLTHLCTCVVLNQLRSEPEQVFGIKHKLEQPRESQWSSNNLKWVCSRMSIHRDLQDGDQGGQLALEQYMSVFVSE